MHATKRGKDNMLEDKRNVITISVVENRAREICISKFDNFNVSSLEIFLTADNHAYNETIMTIRDIFPQEILLHDGSRTKPLSKRIENEFKNSSSILFISRQYFDQDKGADMLDEIIVGKVDADLIAKYIVLSGTYCLLKYIENVSGNYFSRSSLRLVFNEGDSNRMSIDRRAAINLELITNAKSGTQNESLFGFINKTKTAVGARLLRSSILNPSTDIITINTRLDLVEALLGDNRSFQQIVSILTEFPDLDKTLNGLVDKPKYLTSKTARNGIDTLIFLKQALQTAPKLAESLFSIDKTCLDISKQVLIDTIIGNLANSSLNKILDDIKNVITDSTVYSKSSHEMRQQECFALKNGISGLLDVSRKTFLSTVEDIYSLADKYSFDYGVQFKVQFTMLRGYYLSVPSTLTPLPDEFKQAVLNKKSISCTTEEFNSLAARASEAITNALAITNELIQTLLSDIRESIESLFSLTDSVAMIDMLTSFVEVVAQSLHPFSRPILYNDSPLVIKSGRHPVISTLSVHQLESSFVANDLFISPIDNFHVITGPNGSGKSVYIKQIALIVIMAQIGCFVPAIHATIPVRDRILTRIGTNDDMEHNMSTFSTEMKEIAYVLSNLTDRSLILIDELGRGTSNIDGMSIAFAIAESLIFSKAFTLFVTHYPQLTQLAQLYSNVKNEHLKTIVNHAHGKENGVQNIGVKFLHKVGEGACDMSSGYGILMADICGFPKSITEISGELRKSVRDQYPLLLPSPNEDSAIQSTMAVDALIQQLKLLKFSSLSTEEIGVYLHNLRCKISPHSTEMLLEYLKAI
eukprot:gene13442-18022_t